MATHDVESDDEERSLVKEAQDDIESDDSDEADFHERSFKKRLADLAARIKSRNVNVDPQDENSCDRFERECGDCLEHPTPSEEENLLHLIFEDDDAETSPKTYEPIIEFLMRRCPKMFCQRNSNQQSPIYLATMKKRRNFVGFICDNWPETNAEIDPKLHLSALLAQQCVNSKTCLHLAIEKRHRKDFVKKLICNSSKAGLSCQDNKGKTPLHLAVEGENCTEKQLEIVEELIAGCYEAMDKLTKDGLSAYQLHEQTRQAYFKKQSELQTKTVEAGRDNPGDPSGRIGREKDSEGNKPWLHEKSRQNTGIWGPDKDGTDGRNREKLAKPMKAGMPMTSTDQHLGEFGI